MLGGGVQKEEGNQHEGVMVLWREVDLQELREETKWKSRDETKQQTKTFRDDYSEKLKGFFIIQNRKCGSFQCHVLHHHTTFVYYSLFSCLNLSFCALLWWLSYNVFTVGPWHLECGLWLNTFFHSFIIGITSKEKNQQLKQQIQNCIK